MASKNDPGRGYHDIGGLDYGAVAPTATDMKPWERLSTAISNALDSTIISNAKNQVVRLRAFLLASYFSNELQFGENIIFIATHIILYNLPGAIFLQNSTL